MIKISNGRIITPYRMFKGTICIDKHIITYIGDESGSPSDDVCDRVIDAAGLYVSPGFMDIHVHGGGGHDFMDGTEEAFLEAARIHAVHGTTSMVPTTLCSTEDALKRTFEVYEGVLSKNKAGAAFLGIHLEGPYFAMEQKGAQDERYIKKPKRKDYMEILSWSDHIVRWSAAPEHTGSSEFACEMTCRGILPAVAHTNATHEQVLEGFEYGFSHMTHFYSGMKGVHRTNAYRHAGAVESGYLIDEMTVELIADGHHLPESLLELVYMIKGPGMIALTTDAMRGAGMPDGKSILGSLEDGQEVFIEDGVAKMPDRMAFAGSVATMDVLLKTMLKVNGVTLLDAVRMLSATPARIMKVDDRKGRLTVGRDGDIVLFDDDCQIHMTMVEGRIVHES